MKTLLTDPKLIPYCRTSCSTKLSSPAPAGVKPQARPKSSKYLENLGLI